MQLRVFFTLYSSLSSLLKKLKSSFIQVLKDIVRSDVLTASSSLVYFTLISIIPFLIFITPLLRAYGALNPVIDAINGFLVNSVGTEAAGNLISTVTGYVGNGIALGVVGVFLFGYSSITLVNKIKRNLEKVYHVAGSALDKNPLKSLVKSAVYILVMAFLLVLIGAMYSYAHGLLGKPRFFLFSNSFLRRITFDLTIFGLFFLISTVMPSVYVSPKSSLIGSVSFLILFRVINLVIGIMLKYFFKTKSYIYGSAAFIIAALLWLYMFWSVVLISVDFSCIMQYGSINSSSKKTPNQYLVDSVNIMNMIVQGYDAGKGGAFLSTICQELTLPPSQAIEILDKFEKSELVISSGSLKKRRYTPYCRSENLTLYYVIKATLGDYSRLSVGSRVADSILSMQVSEFSDKTLKDFRNFE